MQSVLNCILPYFILCNQTFIVLLSRLITSRNFVANWLPLICIKRTKDRSWRDLVEKSFSPIKVLCVFLKWRLVVTYLLRFGSWVPLRICGNTLVFSDLCTQLRGNIKRMWNFANLCLDWANTSMFWVSLQNSFRVCPYSLSSPNN